MKDHQTDNVDGTNKSEESLSFPIEQQVQLTTSTKHLEVESIPSTSTSTNNAETGSSRGSTLSLKKKKVNINNEVVFTDETSSSLEKPHKPHASSSLGQDQDEVHEGTALQHEDKIQQNGEENYATLSGTIRRGKKGGQCLDVKVNISRNELERLVAANSHNVSRQSNTSSNYCSASRGLHVFLWTLCCFPIIFIISSAYSFYYGTIVWYNVLSLFTEEEETPFFKRILAAPLLILSYPLLIINATFGLGLYSALAQLSFIWEVWLARVQDFEKGFYAWLCSQLGFDECSPYTVVIVSQLQPEENIPVPSNSNNV